ncbi:MAG: hypothetical protein MJE77_34910, partial [Proteobacteria bacterium]|nr:hypothetical protein [Pseudomonadota bacterium]
LSANALSANALSANALSANGLLDTADGRAVAAYLVRCALDEGTSISGEIDGVPYIFHGLLGLVPQWEQAELVDEAKQWISACLLAHVNAFEISVPISVRGAGSGEYDVVNAGEQERIDYRVYEATFFGNVFGDDQEMLACWGDQPSQARTMSSARDLRICSDPAAPGNTTECGFVGLGMCSEVCDERHPGTGAWRFCAGPQGDQYNATLGIWLRNDGTGESPEDGDEAQRNQTENSPHPQIHDALVNDFF